MKTLAFVDAFARSPDVRDALREMISTKVGIDVEPIEMMCMADAYDYTMDQIVVKLRTKRFDVCTKIVRDLMFVYHINQWLVSFCTEPEWSPYP